MADDQTNQKVSIVLGLQYGDEGKGIMTDYLTWKSKRPLVIRFSGGHQVGHTVINRDGNPHVFSNYGSGSFRGAPTYWSRFCTISPPGIVREGTALGITSGRLGQLYVDAMAMVTTAFDVWYNQQVEEHRGGARHGSVGVGFGATVERNTTTPYKLYAMDMATPKVYEQKLRAIARYYREKAEREGMLWFIEAMDDNPIRKDMQYIEDCMSYVQIVWERDFMTRVSALLDDWTGSFDSVIFEGSQGIMLDMDHGIFPNVTRSNTTAKNAIELIRRYDLPSPTINYVTRAYQTRHGAGWMSNEGTLTNFTPPSRETNRHNRYQGEFRLGRLDVDMLNHALAIDNNYIAMCDRTLVVTCVDQVAGGIEYTKGSESFVAQQPADLLRVLNLKTTDVFISRAAETENILRLDGDTMIESFDTLKEKSWSDGNVALG